MYPAQGKLILSFKTPENISSGLMRAKGEVMTFALKLGLEQMAVYILCFLFPTDRQLMLLFRQDAIKSRSVPIEFFDTQSWQWHYCKLCVPTYFQFSSSFVSTDVSKGELDILHITFQGYRLYWTGKFLMAELKKVGKCWHSCIEESLRNFMQSFGVMYL